jgi:pyruvate formate lyase activating enzyme
MEEFSRREFIKWAVACAGICSCAFLDRSDFVSALRLLGVDQARAEEGQVKEEMFYRKLDSLRIECEICPRRCHVAEGKRGYCRNKENRGGKYYSLVYNKVCATHIDPIEKKPFFHYLPGTSAFSLAAAGCNFACKFCQNWEISQARPEEIPHDVLTPDRGIEICRSQAIPTIAYTYSEPTVFYSSMYDMAKKARAAGIGSVMISNGFMNEIPLRELCKQLTAVRIDLKSFSDRFYRTMCSGELAPVLATLQRLKEIGIWFEIIALIIPTLNDNPEEIKKMCAWIKTNLGPDVPIHFSRFHPMYQIQNLPPTPVQTLEMARETAFSAGLHFPYIGNVPGHEAENTYCPSCKKVLIRRIGFEIVENSLKKGSCAFCRQPIPGVWSKEQIFL